MDRNAYKGIRQGSLWRLFSRAKKKRKLAWCKLLFTCFFLYAIVGLLLTLSVVFAIVGVPLLIGACIGCAAMCDVANKTV